MNPLLFGLIEKVIGTVSNFLDPSKKAEAELALLKLQQDASFKEVDTALAYAKQQNDINLVQAGSSSLFISGPRPFLMWVGGVGAAWQWIFGPAVAFIYPLISGQPLPAPLPTVDPNLLWLLGSLMGLQIGARSFEKVKGVAS